MGPWVADALVVLGILVMTIGVYGVVRMPDTYTRLHVASKMVFLGAMPLLLASALAGGQDVALRVILIAFFILLTTPVSAHIVGRAAYLRGERIKGPEPVRRGDEPRLLIRGLVSLTFAVLLAVSPGSTCELRYTPGQSAPTQILGAVAAHDLPTSLPLLFRKGEISGQRLGQVVPKVPIEVHPRVERQAATYEAARLSQA